MLIIYIPLCFYFIMDDLSEPIRANEFTFHYASTLSTFSFSHFLPLSHLHSTMLLLYLQVPSLFIRAYQIYIPLCFYFIDDTILFAERCISYLHSTMLLLYLGVRQCVGVRRCYLHSTMLLLYRNESSEESL